MAVFPTGTTWTPRTSWNLIGLGSSGTNWKFTSDWNPGGKFGGCSLLIWQVLYSENSSQNLPGSNWFWLEPVGHSKDLAHRMVVIKLGGNGRLKNLFFFHPAEEVGIGEDRALPQVGGQIRSGMFRACVGPSLSRTSCKSLWVASF